MNLRNTARGGRLNAAFALALSTGMRRGEILGLRRVDLDLEAAQLTINQTLIAIGYETAFSTPKTANGRRTIDLDAETMRILRAHLAP